VAGKSRCFRANRVLSESPRVALAEASTWRQQDRRLPSCASVPPAGGARRADSSVFNPAHLSPATSPHTTTRRSHEKPHSREWRSNHRRRGVASLVQRRDANGSSLSNWRTANLHARPRNEEDGVSARRGAVSEGAFSTRSCAIPPEATRHGAEQLHDDARWAPHPEEPVAQQPAARTTALPLRPLTTGVAQS